MKSSKILIVEDDEPILAALTDKIRATGAEVYQAHNGRDGLSLATSIKPDLILLDIVMPVMDGVEMLKNLRKDPWGSTVRVMVLTNLSDVKMLDECKSCGTFDYLIKAEWSLDDLVSKITTASRG